MILGSPALVIVPNDAEFATVVPGALKFTLLNTLKNLNRNCIEHGPNDAA